MDFYPRTESGALLFKRFYGNKDHLNHVSDRFLSWKTFVPEGQRKFDPPPLDDDLFLSPMGAVRRREPERGV